MGKAADCIEALKEEKGKGNGLNSCPFCGNESGIDSEEPVVQDNDKITQKVYCNSCGKGWQNTFKLTSTKELK